MLRKSHSGIALLIKYGSLTKERRLEKMAEKVKVSRETANALETALDRGSKETLLIYHCSGFTDEGKLQEGSVWTQQEYIGLNFLSPEELAIALYVGYEIEETPEEKFLRVYRMDLERNRLDFADGMKYALETLGIKIKGVNC